MSNTASLQSGNPGGSFARGWPATLLVLIVLGAAAFAFSPRPAPPFPPTAVHPDQLLVNGLAREGSRLVAVGEQGAILIADNPAGPWNGAKVEPNRGSTFTAVAFIGDGIALAAGHDSWIVRSQDHGQTWKEVYFDAEQSQPLLGIAGPYDGKLFAFGAFGQFLTSADQGQTWQKETLVEASAPGKPAKPVAVVNPDDPFGGAAAASNGISDHHFNAMTRAADGSLILVGERGLIARSRDVGKTWTAAKLNYKGSFYGVIAAPQELLVFGMRGNAFVSKDSGQSWQKSEVPVQVSLFGGALQPGGDIVLVGDNNSVLVSNDGGAHFTLASQAQTRGLAAGLSAVIPLDDGRLLTGGDGGLALQKMSANGAQP